MKISVNPLTTQQTKFLKSENPLGFNKSQYQSDITKHLEKSIRYLHHIAKYPWNLKKDELYDTLNAHSIKNILENLLKEVQTTSEYRKENYDFRTVEIARTLYHISTIYLMKSAMWDNEKQIGEDIARVSLYFRTLSKQALENDSNELIKKDEEIKLLNKIKKLRDSNSDYYKLDRKWNKLVKEKREATDSKLRDKINRKIDETTIERNIEYEIIDKKESKIRKVLSHKYDHLHSYFCPYDKLAPFEWVENP